MTTFWPTEHIVKPKGRFYDYYINIRGIESQALNAGHWMPPPPPPLDCPHYLRLWCNNQIWFNNLIGRSLCISFNGWFNPLMRGSKDSHFKNNCVNEIQLQFISISFKYFNVQFGWFWGSHQQYVIIGSTTNLAAIRWYALLETNKDPNIQCYIILTFNHFPAIHRLLSVLINTL